MDISVAIAADDAAKVAAATATATAADVADIAEPKKLDDRGMAAALRDDLPYARELSDRACVKLSSIVRGMLENLLQSMKKNLDYIKETGMRGQISIPLLISAAFGDCKDNAIGRLLHFAILKHIKRSPEQPPSVLNALAREGLLEFYLMMLIRCEMPIKEAVKIFQATFEERQRLFAAFSFFVTSSASAPVKVETNEQQQQLSAITKSAESATNSIDRNVSQTTESLRALSVIPQEPKNVTVVDSSGTSMTTENFVTEDVEEQEATTQEALSIDSELWSCSACTYLNSKDSSHCGICETVNTTLIPSSARRCQRGMSANDTYDDDTYDDDTEVTSLPNSDLNPNPNPNPNTRKFALPMDPHGYIEHEAVNRRLFALPTSELSVELLEQPFFELYDVYGRDFAYFSKFYPLPVEHENSLLLAGQRMTSMKALCVVSEAECRENWAQLSMGVFDGVDLRNTFFAGGAILGCVMPNFEV